ncbi:gag/pol protein [Cucumis melo var. makuwa]|uniref:Gag/pol protein n=1 Tax=Cucumis melo var. makuwa TaxID=1194695 RepID=A0A5D3DHW4_CUCMM|nr:gag/pol protein [Cucumis melo var. makuwa]
MITRSFTRKSLRVNIPSELIHSDLCGPMNYIKVQGGSQGYVEKGYADVGTDVNKSFVRDTS